MTRPTNIVQAAIEAPWFVVEHRAGADWSVLAEIPESARYEVARFRSEPLARHAAETHNAATQRVRTIPGELADATFREVLGGVALGGAFALVFCGALLFAGAWA